MILQLQLELDMLIGINVWACVQGCQCKCRQQLDSLLWNRCPNRFVSKHAGCPRSSVLSAQQLQHACDAEAQRIQQLHSTVANIVLHYIRWNV